MLVKRTVAINHRPSYLRGKYGLTITHMGQSDPNVHEFATDEELSALLLLLEHSEFEIHQILSELEPADAQLKYDREFEEDKLTDIGF